MEAHPARNATQIRLPNTRAGTGTKSDSLPQISEALSSHRRAGKIGGAHTPGAHVRSASSALTELWTSWQLPHSMQLWYEIWI